MAFIFRLPDIGEGLEEAEIVEWFVAIGDEVLRDQPLVEVLTDKASSELPSPVAGTVLLLGANEGTRLQVGEVLIEIDDGSTAPRVADEPTSTQTGTANSQPTEPITEVTPRTARPKAAPATRRLALDLGVDLTRMIGTGPGGRITLDDIHAATPSPTGPTGLSNDRPTALEGLGQAPIGRHDLRGIRGVVARNMVQAWSEIPHIHLSLIHI